MSREKDLLEMCFDTLKNLKEIRETVKVLGWD